MNDSESFAADKVSSFIIGVSIVVGLIMIFFDWRYTVLSILLVWNQLIFKSSLRGVDTKLKFTISIGLIIIFIWNFFISN